MDDVTGWGGSWTRVRFVMLYFDTADPVRSTRQRGYRALGKAVRVQTLTCFRHILKACSESLGRWIVRGHVNEIESASGGEIRREKRVGMGGCLSTGAKIVASKQRKKKKKPKLFSGLGGLVSELGGFGEGEGEEYEGGGEGFDIGGFDFGGFDFGE